MSDFPVFSVLAEDAGILFFGRKEKEFVNFQCFGK